MNRKLPDFYYQQIVAEQHIICHLIEYINTSIFTMLCLKIRFFRYKGRIDIKKGINLQVAINLSGFKLGEAYEELYRDISVAMMMQ